MLSFFWFSFCVLKWTCERNVRFVEWGFYYLNDYL